MKYVQLFEQFINETGKKPQVFRSKDGRVDYYVEEDRIGRRTQYLIVSKVKGFPPTEAWDDWFGSREDAEEIAKKLAAGELEEKLFLGEGEEEKQSTDRSPIDNEAIETGLKNKSEETGCPIGILRAVMRRGMAAWKSGHRPGAGQEQWGYARINSFLTGGEGTWGKADSDLAKEARDAGFNPKK